MNFRKDSSAALWLLFGLTVNLNFSCAASTNPAPLNDTTFAYQDLQLCRRNEFYDLNYFACITCSTEEDTNELLQPTADKFACECRGGASTATLYQATKEQSRCVDICSWPNERNAAIKSKDCLPAETIDAISEGNCQFKYLNGTAAWQGHGTNATQRTSGGAAGTRQHIQLTAFHPQNHSDCSSCDAGFNYQHKGYCIANALMRPYLRYNSYWQSVPTAGSSTSSAHFGDLKYVAFFCLALKNATACNQLANLCVLSRYAFDKNSPCNAFLLSQATDDAYATSMDDQLSDVRPFLFYRRGKATARMLAQPIVGLLPYSLNSPPHNYLRFVSTTHALDGTLKRFDSFKPHLVDLCDTQTHAKQESKQLHEGILFANHASQQRAVLSQCWLTLEQLIDVARLQANNHFMSLFLNYSRNTVDKGLEAEKPYLQAVPVLIEDLTAANQRLQQPEEWQLVKRFQLIEAHTKHRTHMARPYADAHKLQLFHTLRYVSSFELHYKIHEGNRISPPLLRLRYQNIQLQANSSLATLHPYRLAVSFERVDPQRQVLNAATLPVLMLCAVALAGLQAFNFRRRHRARHASATVGSEFCDLAGLWEFVLRLTSHTADALLLAYLIYVASSAMRYYSRHTVDSTLPLQQSDDDAALGTLIYAALLLKCTFLAVHGWHISHVDMFFVDWERPRNYDSNHFNLKSNLETSSLCSSVRTFVSECNVSAWRVFYTANEWIRLSGKTKTSTLVQCIALLIVFELLDGEDFTHGDLILRLFVIASTYVVTQLAQLLFSCLLAPQLLGHPLQRFVDLCALANVSVFTLVECASYGFYIHGRSPHGFADTDMTSMVLQLQREAQNMCGRRGLLSDSDQQTYVIVPPTNLRAYFEKLLVPFQRSCSISQAHYQKAETASGNSEGNLVERNAVAYSSVNRFFCAFIDHAIKDMDYIITEKTFAEKLFNCEFDNYLTENKGTFYIDQGYSFAQLFLYGNQRHIFVLELLLIVCLFNAGVRLRAIIAIVCLLNKLLQCVFRAWVRRNVAAKTLIDKRFLM